MLKRNISIVSVDAWKIIDKRAKEVLNSYLSARKVVKVNGPKGWNFTSVSEGRLDSIENYKGVNYGYYSVKPLIEPRVDFELDRWELDNIVRGKKDIDLKPLEDAVKKIALFEDDVIYKGIEKGNISGLINDSNVDNIDFGNEYSQIMEAITSGVIKLKEAFVKKPYTLVVGQKAFKLINKEINGYPLIKKIEDFLETKVVFSHILDNALLLPYNDEDLEMTVGQDFSIGYQDSNSKKVSLFITESFTYRTLNENIIIKYNLE